MNRRKLMIGTVVVVLMASLFNASQARITKIIIDETNLSSDGFIEIITGRAFGELDPEDRLNSGITDIENAPLNVHGKVEYVSRFTLKKPINMFKSTGILWYDLVNRGRPVSQSAAYIAPEQHGHAALISGWQADIIQTDKNWTVQAPIARNIDGSSIIGYVLARLANIDDTNTATLAMLSNAIPYDAASLDTSRANVVVKDSEQRSGKIGSMRNLRSDEWAFSNCSKVPFPGTPDPRKICLKDGFDVTKLYEISYEAKDPIVLGIGLAAVRDVVSFFRYEDVDDAGTPNPVAGQISRAIGQGISQSGNALKTFLLLGFNEDESNRIVFDGINPHIAGRLTSINLRFGLPSGSGTLYEPGGEGTLWWAKYEDKIRGRKPSSLLDLCATSKTCPRIFETFGAAEFNARLMTVALTGTDSKQDLPLPENVRRYYFPGTTHGGDIDGGFDATQQPVLGCVLSKNPNTEVEQMNALRVALANWVLYDVPPPASSYPTLHHNELASNTAEAMGYPVIPSSPAPDGMAIGLFDYDFGDGLNYADFSGVITKQPPIIKKIIPALMPKVDANGNEIAGIPSVLHQAPLGTYTGWNLTANGFFKGQPCGGGLTGGYIPFAKTKAERIVSGDSRMSLEELYGTQRGYLCRVDQAIARERERKMLLEQDAIRLRQQAASSINLPLTTFSDVAIAAEAESCKP